MAENFGVKVKLWRTFKGARRLDGTRVMDEEEYTELRNVTEIHYNHGRKSGRKTVYVAFESEIHHTGANCELSTVLEFETEPETEKVAEGF